MADDILNIGKTSTEYLAEQEDLTDGGGTTLHTHAAANISGIETIVSSNADVSVKIVDDI